MAKQNTDTVELDEVEAETPAADEKPKGMRPKELAEELEIDAKTLRSFLRKEFPRSPGEKNTSWVLTDEHANAAREHFAGTEDEDDSDSDEDDE